MRNKNIIMLLMSSLICQDVGRNLRIRKVSNNNPVLPQSSKCLPRSKLQ